jgi:Signal transduction histidine kinase involved in nitrogen fixation and metabolism regulation
MKIKTKLTFGITFLFAAFLIVGGSSLYFTLKVSKQNLLIMKDNHLSLGYTENMLQSIDNINTMQASYIFNQNYLLDQKELTILLKNFEQNLSKEENNITEIGEKEQVQLLKENFDKYRTLLSLSVRDSVKDKPHFYFANVLPTFTGIKTIIFAISDLNMQAIVRKNDTANETASHSYLVLSAVTSICFLVFFFFIFGFPSYIANPIKELTESVREIAARNFTVRVHFATNDEFGEISNAFNTMASRLEEFDNSPKSMSLYGEERAEAVMEKIPEALIVLDEYQNITFINIFAEKLLGLNRFDIMNKYAPDVALNNEVLRFLIKDMDQSYSKQEASIMLEYHGKKTKFVREITMITIPKKDSELVVPIGHMIFLKNATEIGEG